MFRKMGIIFCTKCGLEAAPDDNYCSACGEKFRTKGLAKTDTAVRKETLKNEYPVLDQIIDSGAYMDPQETEENIQEFPLPKNSWSIPSLVLGILSAFFFEFLIPPIAALLASGLGISRAIELKGMGYEKTGFGFSLTGIILGTVYLLLSFYFLTWR